MVPAAHQPQLALVRVAASTRANLFGLRWWIAAWIVSSTVTNVFNLNGSASWWLGIAVIVGYWAWQRKHAIWVERDSAEIRVRSRRGWHATTNSPASSDTTIATYPAATPVVFHDDAKWWRAGRTLQIGPDRYSIFPDGRRLAGELAASSRWRTGSESTNSH